MAAASPEWEDIGGSDETSVVNTFWYWGIEYKVKERKVTRTRRKTGVTRAVAEGYASSRNISSSQAKLGAVWALVENGTNTTYSHAQISGSNLYEVTETVERITQTLTK